MESFVSGIAIAILSGITFIAYKHPDFYQKIEKYISTVIAIFIAGIAIWNTALTYAFIELNEFIEIENTTEATESIEKLKLIDINGWFILIWFLFLGYLFFLSSMPYLLKNNPQKTPKKD